MAEQVIPTRSLTLWYNGERWPEFYWMIEIERIRRAYDVDGQPMPRWRAILSSYSPEKIEFLRDFPIGCELLVTYKEQGRRDIFKQDEVIGRLKDCRPVRAWMEDFVRFQVDSVMTYKLSISCEFELCPMGNKGDGK